MREIHVVPIGEEHERSRDCPCDPWIDDALRIIRHRREPAPVHSGDKVEV